MSTLNLTLSDGQKVQRVFAGFITSEGDLLKFIEELRREFHSRKRRKQQPILCEMWEYITPIAHEHEMVLPSGTQELEATQTKGE